MCTYTVRVETIEKNVQLTDENSTITLSLSCEIIGLGKVSGSAEVQL